jgi:putative addiction module component (TIGR02574 family)
MTDQSGETKLEEDLEEEIRRRIEEIRSGEVKAIPWEEARDILGWDRKPESER